MRTTIEIDDKLLLEVMKSAKAGSKKKAIEVALKEYLKAKGRRELKEMIGRHDEFGLSLKDLERMRRDD